MEARPRRMALTIAVLALALATDTARAQTVPTRTLKEPSFELEESFSQVTSLRELRDGRVVIADAREKKLAVFDMKGGASTAIGREGAGPLEWGSLGSLLAWRGDSTLLADSRNSRFLVLGPNGKAVRLYSPTTDEATASVGATPASGGGPVRRTIGSGPVSSRGSDRQGRLYYQSFGITLGPNGPVTADSAPIVRFDPDTRRHDTLAYVNLPKTNDAATNSNSGGQQRTMFVSMPKPFNPADDWRVTQDGRVIIARVNDYHLEIVHPDGRRVRGPANRFAPILVTEADKKAFATALASGRPTMMVNGQAVQAPAPSMPAEWPTQKPAFPSGGLAIAPNGDAWVFRSRAAADDVPVADVFDARGQLSGRVALPAKSRFLGFGANGVYVARVDEDDLLYVQLHPMSWGTAR